MSELTTQEIRKLVKAHNVLSSIKIPPKSTKAQIIALIQKNGYTVNHKLKALIPRGKPPKNVKITLDSADKILKKPEKTALQKKKAEELKAKKVEAKAKELKLAKKEAVKEFKQKKAEAIKKPVKKQIQKKPVIKKEDDVRPAKTPYPTIPPNVKGKRIPKGQLLLQDKKDGQVIKPPSKPYKSSLKDKLIAQDKKNAIQENKDALNRKIDKQPYKPVAPKDSLKDKILKLIDYFFEDKNKIGKTFKTVKEVNNMIGDVFSSVKGKNGDPLNSLDTSERKYFIKLMNHMLRYSTQESTGVEVTKRALQKYKGWYSDASAAAGIKAQKDARDAPKKLENQLLQVKKQIEYKPSIRAKEKAKKKKGIPGDNMFDYEETSGYSSAVKSVLISLYANANGIINTIKQINPTDFVDKEHKKPFIKKFDDDYEVSIRDIGEDIVDDKIQPIYDDLSQELEDAMDEIMEKNRKSTGWVKPKPELEKLQKRYIRFNKEGKSNSAYDVKLLIKQHYKESDVPGDKPKFKIDKSKQPKQTPSKIDIKIKPDSNTNKIKPPKKKLKNKFPTPARSAITKIELLQEILGSHLNKLKYEYNILKQDSKVTKRPISLERHINAIKKLQSNLKEGKINDFSASGKSVIKKALIEFLKGNLSGPLTEEEVNMGIELQKEYKIPNSKVDNLSKFKI